MMMVEAQSDERARSRFRTVANSSVVTRRLSSVGTSLADIRRQNSIINQMLGDQSFDEGTVTKVWKADRSAQVWEWPLPGDVQVAQSETMFEAIFDYRPFESSEIEVLQRAIYHGLN